MNPKDAGAIARVMRDQHGPGAENFVRSQIQRFRENKTVADNWRAVLDALVGATRYLGDAEEVTG